MPDQPDDPLHYEMKIPPEPKKPEPQHKSDEPPSKERADAGEETQPSCGDGKP